MTRSVQARIAAGSLIAVGVVALTAAAAAAWPRPATTATGGTCAGPGVRTPVTWTVYDRETGNVGSPATIVDVHVTPGFPTVGAGATLPNTGSSSTTLTTVVPLAYTGPITLSYTMSWAGTAGTDQRPGTAHINVVACPVGLPTTSSTTPCSTTVGCNRSTTTSTLPTCGPPSSQTTATTRHRPTCKPVPTTATTAPKTSTTICTITTTTVPATTTSTVPPTSVSTTATTATTAPKTSTTMPATTTSTTEAPTTTTEAPTTSTTEAPTSTTEAPSSTSTTVMAPVPSTPPSTPGPVTLGGPPKVAAETLPVTGSETLPLLAVGVVLLAGGLMLVRWSNRVA